MAKNNLNEVAELAATKAVVKAEKRFQEYIGAVKEDLDHKLEAIFEYVQDIPTIKEKQEIMFEQMGSMAEDITVIKETVKDHEHRLQQLESR